MILRLSKHPKSSEFNRLQRAARNRFNSNHLETARIYKFQQGVESGSGPGGRRFKSSFPDQQFSYFPFRNLRAYPSFTFELDAWSMSIIACSIRGDVKNIFLPPPDARIWLAASSPCQL